VRWESAGVSRWLRRDPDTETTGKSSLMNGIASVQKNAGSATTDDETSE